jgi:SAM-dependent methyltransferase
MNHGTQRRQIATSRHHVGTSFQEARIPLPDTSTDVFLSYYSLEHIQKPPFILDEIFKILKSGGRLIGAIPTEGGMAWGVGRWLTTRRILQDRFGFDMEKIICWEHPNFADEVIRELRKRGALQTSNWPLPMLSLDLNLLVMFSVVKRT